jgi:hypothetical protein
VRAVEVTVLPEEPALQLLLRAVYRQGALAPNHPDHADARAIYRLLGGLPLALEIAAAFLVEWPEVSLANFRQRLHREGRLATLDAEGEELSPANLRGVHAAAVAATLGEQWDALGTGKPVDEDARLLLRIAGQLPEAAQIPAARLGLLAGMAAGDASGQPSRLQRALRRLERASLITPSFRQASAKRLLAAYQDVAVLEQQCAQRGIDALEQDLRSALDLLPVDRETPDSRQALQKLLRMVQHESHMLRGWDQTQQPALFLQQWRKRALIGREPQQAEAAIVGLAQLAVPHLAM